jgi:aryl-alcohol dehydrogenase-like predicted oxidoreductase
VLTAASIRQECEDGLRRLKVDIIDLYQIHWPVDDVLELEEGWETMAKLQWEGKVRWIGVSNFNVEQMKRAQAIAPITSLQPRYSLVHPDVERDILPFCQHEGIGVIVYSPMASGLLTGAMTRDRMMIGAKAIQISMSRICRPIWHWCRGCVGSASCMALRPERSLLPGHCTTPP